MDGSVRPKTIIDIAKREGFFYFPKKVESIDHDGHFLLY
ncbi:MAG: hypothetical protein ACQEWF_05905 [Bacillota bacterium]